MKGKQSWVTSASDDDEGIKALMLARSLRNVITRRLLTIFVSFCVSEELRVLLEERFDRCIILDKKQLSDYHGLPFTTVAKLNSWNLFNLRKFVFLDCNSVVLINSDEVFKQQGFSLTKDKVNETAMIADNTSKSKFIKFLDVIKSFSKTNGAENFSKMFNEGCLLDTKYNFPLDLLGENLEINLSEMKIIRFSKVHPIEILTDKTANSLKLGVIEQAIFDKTLEIFKSETTYLSKFVPKFLKETLNGNNSESVNVNKLKEVDESVAIVGLSFRLPGANNLDEFWDLLINGKEGIIPVPEGRWEEYIGTECIGKAKEAGFLNCPIDQIDAKFFGLSPMEVSFTDPQQRLTLQVIWEAFEHAGINPNSLKNSKAGVFGGWWRNDYKEQLQQEGINEQDFFRTYMGNSLGTLTGRISHVLELTGPSISTESGCSTSIVAVDMACKSLLNEDCDLGLAFGVNLLLHPFSPEIMSSVIAPDGRCKTFDAKADGFGRAEGCTVLVLKRYSDAIRDGDRVWGLIRGSAVVQEGPSRSLGTPTVQCEALAMELALEDAGVEAKDVSFVEAHGTGTAIGDPMEVAAIAKIYSSKERENDLVIGSVKTNIGHTESCCGIAGIIKTLLALEHKAIPPHRNFETLNPEIKLEQIPALIPMTPYKWNRNSNGKPRLAGVSSFGITGTDAHVIIQETPELSVHSGLKLHAKMPLHLLKISAKSPEALKDLQIKYKKFLENTKENLTDICYTASTGRGDFSHRSVILGSDKAEMIKNLEKISSDLSVQVPKLCFLFTGQGSQYPGMAKALYDHSPVFRMHFDNSDKILSRVLGISIKNALWGDKTQELGLTIYSQTSIFCVEYCLLKLWESWGIKPDFVLGHSLGEFAAAVAAGILTFSDALTLVAERSRLINNLPTGKMLVVKECQEKVDVLLKAAFAETAGYLDYAAINSEEQTVLAGSEENVLKFAELLRNNDIKTMVLQSTHAFHSRQMEPMLEEYRKTASKMNYGPLKKCTFISGMDGNVKEVGEVETDYWIRHTREPVRFLKASKSILETGETISFLEIGPHPILSALILNNADTLCITQPLSCLPSMRRNDGNWSTILNTLGNLYKQGMDINWKNFYQFSGGRVVTIPFYSFQNKTFSSDVNKSGKQKAIHPLLGNPVPNASQLKLFQNEQSVLKTPYLKDHVIGNTIIMPGAGFMEMCLVAGQAAFQGYEGGYIFPAASVTIQDFIIEGPLALNENETTLIQAVVTTDDSTGDTRVTIYSKLVLDKETHKWIRHATGIFCPYGVQEQKMKDTLEEIKFRCSEKLTTNDSYDKFSEFGLNFGPTFRNLVTGYQGVNDVYFKIRQPSELNTDEYILHPVILDAMFQAVAIINHSDTNQLHVPISITKLIWHAKLTTQTSYVHLCKTKSSDEEQVVTLYDENGLRIVTMIGASLLPTNVSTIMMAIEGQKTSLPSIYQEVWRDELGPWERRVPDLSFFATIYSDRFKDRFNILSQDEEYYYDNANELCSLYIIRVFSELGWDYKIGQISSLNALLAALGIPATFKQFTRYMLTVLVEDGYLEKTSLEDDFGFKVLTKFPSGEALSNDIEKLYWALNPSENVASVSVWTVADNLHQILSGKQSALPILFPEDPTEFQPLEEYYKNCNASQHCYKVMTDICVQPLEILKSSLLSSKAVYRILEVGAGTGSLTSHVLKYLTGPASGYEYTYTDISKVFFSSGEKVFQNSEIRVIYKTLNIETDPTLQGFIPHYYDMICASFVVHATKNIRNSLVNLRNLLRPGGALVLTELTKPLREINLTVGVLEGFWAFEDYDLRPNNCEMSGDKWEKVMRSAGFSSTAVFPVYKNHDAFIMAMASDNDLGYIKDYLPVETTSKTWVVFSNHIESTKIVETKLSQIGRHVILVNSSIKQQHLSTSTHYKLNLNKRSQPLLEMQTLFKDLFTNSALSLDGVIYIVNLDTNNENKTEFKCEEYFYLCQTLVCMNSIKLFVLTRGILSLDDQNHHEITSPFPGPLFGMTKGLQNENTTLICRSIDMNPSGSLLEGIDDAFTELFVQDGECIVAYRDNQRKVSRFVPQKMANNSLKFPSHTDRSRLMLATSNAIQDLRFGPDTTYEFGENDVEIQVRTFALNFRDVLVILKPSKQFEDFSSVGIDFSGVVTAIGSNVSLYKLGDAVVGMHMHGRAFPSHIVTNERMVMPMQEDMTFNEAATLPVVSFTIYMSFFKDKKLRKNDTILIHTGSGGVGLYAIQAAKMLNCTIIATAGNTRKRNYLRGLGVKHVFNSRNTEYGTQIREALGGQGVDFVLNSLTGVGFKEASLSVCNYGAKFIEMSKLNVWSPEEVKVLRPDVYYEIVDTSGVPTLQAVEYMREMAQIHPLINKPIPYVRFDAADIRDALNYLQKAKHIGKIVCVMPQPIMLQRTQEMIMPLFNDRSSYLITGGLGGIGIEIAKWMVQTGAKDIILVGRNAPNKKAAEEIEIMRSNGKNIHVKQCDVSDFSQCQSLLKTIKDSGLPTLRGIMHAAGVLSDGLLENQTWEKYEQVFDPKIRGGWNLHLLTLDYPLEHFVMFSSVAGLFGGLGQSNHSAGNMFLDCFAHYRNYMGLPASTVNWGPWGQVGVAANMEIVGFKPMSTLQCVSALEKLMKMNSVQSCVCEADYSIVKKIFPTTRKHLSEFQNIQDKGDGIKENSDEFWAEYDTSDDSEGCVHVVKKYLCSVIRRILKLGENESLDEQDHFQNMGMDSLMMIEMKNALQSFLGDRVKITMNSVKDCSTITQLSNRIVELISGTKELPLLNREELNQLIREDATLPVHIKPENLKEACKPSQIQIVLITGVSGNLGPYILQEIVKRHHIEKVYCLMRGSVKQSAESRLRTILSEKEMEYSSLIECVVGNVIQNNFGIEQEKYAKLAEEVDAIFHVAVKASFQELYQKLPDSDRDIRTVNVLGTKNVLEFACTGKTKIVYHTSSLVAVSKLDEDKRMDEDWPNIDECNVLPNDAYVISKFIGDILMAQAVERGVPCKVFRFPFIGGDSKTGGNISVLNNSLLLRMMSYMHLGVMPAVSFPFMILPVDLCAELSCRICFNDETGWEVYNINNPKINDELDVKDIVHEFGYQIDIVPSEKFVEKVKLKENSELLLMLKKAVENFNQVVKMAEGNTFALGEAWISENKKAFFSNKLEKWIPEYPECMEQALDILKRDLLHAKNSGIFERLRV